MSAQPLTFVYDTVNNVALDVYLPSETYATPRPAVIAFHGGGITAGSKRDAFFPTYLIDKLLPKGVLLISANYRLLYPSTASDIVDDTHTLFRYLADPSTRFANALREIGMSLDTTRLAVLGISGGNYPARAASTISTVQPHPKAHISLYGMANDFLLDHWVQPKASRYKTLAFEEDKINDLLIAGGGPISSDAPIRPIPALKAGGDETNRVGLFSEFQYTGTYLDYLLNTHGLSEKVRQVPQESRSSLIPEEKRRWLLPLTDDTVPTYFIHGTKDTVVDPQESINGLTDYNAKGIKTGFSSKAQNMA